MRLTRTTLFTALACVISAAVSTASFAQSASAGPSVKPVGVAKLAGQPVPAGAKSAASAGSGAMAVNTANVPSDQDSVWVAKFDIDGDGNLDETSFLWDNEDKVLFAYADDSFTCNNGATGSGGMLIGVNATGNPRNRPAGSGFWVAQLDKSECGAALDCLWGCKFDGTGASTACGTVTMDEANDDIVVTVISKP